jgi:putative ABC transport system ATP-binding protein
MLLRATGLGRRIADAWIWRGVDVQLQVGENLAILGPTGAGKSLLLRCLAGLDAADEGRIVVDDRPLDEWRMPSYRARVVYLHQRPALWEGTVEDNLRAVFRLAAHRSRGYDRSHGLRWLAAFDRDEAFLGKATAELSGGEAEIVALIRALGVEPSVLLLDEPSASMDATATRQAEELLKRWVHDAPNRASVWTSHDADQVRRVADRTLTLGGVPGAAS